MNRLLVLLFLSFPALLSAQFKSTGAYTYGGEFDEEGDDIILTSDGGYFVTGSTSSFGSGNSDVYVLKLDSLFQVQWSKAIGGPQIDRGKAAVQTPDGGYLVVGYTNSYGSGGYDGYSIKLDSDGELEYEDYWGGSDWDFFYDVVRLDNGEALLVGETKLEGSLGTDAFLVKLNVFGIELWTRTYGGTADDRFRSCVRKGSNNLVCAGESSSYSTTSDLDHYVMELNLDGDSISQSVYGGSFDDGLNEVKITSTGGLLLSGYSKSEHSSIDRDAQMLRIEADTVRWIKNAGHSSSLTNRADEFTSAFEKADGNIYYTGYTQTFGNGGGDLIISVATDGGWDIPNRAGTIGGSNSDVGEKILSKGDHGAVVVGHSKSFGGEYGNILVFTMDSVQKIDDMFSDTNVAFIHFEDTLSPSMYLNVEEADGPNTAENSEISIRGRVLEVDPGSDYELKIFDTNSRLLFQAKGKKPKRFELDAFRGGIYFLSYQSFTEKSAGCILIQDD